MKNRADTTTAGRSIANTPRASGSPRPRTRVRSRVAFALSMLLAAGALVGCAATGGAGPAVWLVLGALVAFGVACTTTTPAETDGTTPPNDTSIQDTSGHDALNGDGSDSHEPGDDVADANEADTNAADTNAADTDIETDAGGIWESCCSGGTISTCFCPSGAECNYGWYTPCENNTCVAGPEAECPGSGDADTSDASSDVSDGESLDVSDAGEGTWEACCENGQISTCFCPAGMACNYGWFTACDNGGCVNIDGECPGQEQDATDIDEQADSGEEPDIFEPQDAGEPGNWEPCCESGKISSCFCPIFVACNYGWFKACGDNTCVAPFEDCP